MMMTLLRVPLAALALVALCSVAHSETLKDIRKVSVVGDGSVSKAVVELTGQQLKRSVRATRRPVPLPKVSMEVQLANEVRGAGAQAGRNSADVTVLIRGGPGAPVGSERFTVNSFMTGKAVERALANAISQRIAVTYSLAPVRAAPTGSVRPAKAYRKQPATGHKQTASHAPAKVSSAPVADPVIIPSEAALTVKPRVRKAKAEANAAKKAAPCVVTATTSCN